MRKYAYAGLAVAVLLAAAVYALVSLQHPTEDADDPWNRPWDEVRSLSEEICGRYTATDAAYFDKCMAVEKESFELLQGDFGLSRGEAEALKRSCAGFHYFTPQLKCVEDRLRTREG